MQKLKGRSDFSMAEIEELKKLIKLRVHTSSDKQKGVRKKMRDMGFYGEDDWGIRDCQVSDLDHLIKVGKIRICDSQSIDVKEYSIQDESKQLGVIFSSNIIMNEISENLIRKIQKCKKCKTIIKHKKFPEVSHGSHKGKYLLVSEAPGKESLNKGKYWTGVGGQILRSCTLAVNTTLEELFYLTDIVKCWPNENDTNRTPTLMEIMNCSHFLSKEIDSLKPQLILAFGKPASSYLLGREVKVKSEHGKVYKYNNTNSMVLVMLHPSNIDRHIDRQLYIKQLTSLFIKLKENKLKEIVEIFK